MLTTSSSLPTQPLLPDATTSSISLLSVPACDSIDGSSSDEFDDDDDCVAVEQRDSGVDDVVCLDDGVTDGQAGRVTVSVHFTKLWNNLEYTIQNLKSWHKFKYLNNICLATLTMCIA